jgi:WD40 repeat protein/ankyrin repeat protein
MHAWAAGWAETLTRLQNRPDSPGLRNEIDHAVVAIEHHWQVLQHSQEQADLCTLAGARLLIARCHGFVNWQKFEQHLDSIPRVNAPATQFEAAADAIVEGDISTLRRLLRENPELVRARSTREHQSTLLHYVSANGVEHSRQKTPSNIVEIARLLLDAGADVNAESRAYGGGTTTLGLTATNFDLDAAGVQLALLGLLIDAGALIGGPDSGSGVNVCLSIGHGEAAEYLAHRGARLDLEGAAGVGRLDIVRSFIDASGEPKPEVTHQQRIDAFNSACTFGRNSVIEFLLDRGMEVNTSLKGGSTALHWAAYEGHADTVRLLLERGAQVAMVDMIYKGTPLHWALYGRGTARPRERERRSYYETVALLVRAGSKLDPAWFAGGADRELALQKMRSDPRMMSVLRGELPGILSTPPKPLVNGGRVVQLQIKTPRDLTCAFSPDRTRAATGVVGRSVRVWNVETGDCLAQLVGHTERIWGVAWSRDGQRILSGARDNTARLWDAASGKCLQVLKGHAGFVRDLDFSTDGKRAITAGGDRRDRSVRVWDLETAECLQVLEGHTDGAYCALLASDGRRAVSGSRDGTIRVWEIGSGHCRRVIDAHASHVQDLAWSRGEQRVLSCSLHIRLWDLESGRCLQAFEGHTDTIRTVDWSPDERFVLSASHDRTVRVWEVASGQCVKVLEGHPTLVVGAAWSPDQRHVISCDEDAQLRIWDWSE